MPRYLRAVDFRRRRSRSSASASQASWTSIISVKSWPTVRRPYGVFAVQQVDGQDVFAVREDKVELPPDVLCREIAFYLQAGAHSTVRSP